MSRDSRPFFAATGVFDTTEGRGDNPYSVYVATQDPTVRAAHIPATTVDPLGQEVDADGGVETDLDREAVVAEPATEIGGDRSPDELTEDVLGASETEIRDPALEAKGEEGDAEADDLPPVSTQEAVVHVEVVEPTHLETQVTATLGVDNATANAGLAVTIEGRAGHTVGNTDDRGVEVVPPTEAGKPVADEPVEPKVKQPELPTHKLKKPTTKKKASN